MNASKLSQKKAKKQKKHYTLLDNIVLIDTLCVNDYYTFVKHLKTSIMARFKRRGTPRRKTSRRRRLSRRINSYRVARGGIRL